MTDSQLLSGYRHDQAKDKERAAAVARVYPCQERRERNADTATPASLAWGFYVCAGRGSKTSLGSNSDTSSPS